MNAMTEIQFKIAQQLHKGACLRVKSNKAVTLTYRGETSYMSWKTFVGLIQSGIIEQTYESSIYGWTSEYVTYELRQVRGEAVGWQIAVKGVQS